MRSGLSFKKVVAVRAAAVYRPEGPSEGEDTVISALSSIQPLFEESLRKAAPWSTKKKQVTERYKKYFCEEYDPTDWVPGAGSDLALRARQRILSTSPGGQVVVGICFRTPETHTEPALTPMRYNARLHSDTLLNNVRAPPYNCRMSKRRMLQDIANVMPRKEEETWNVPHI